MLQGTLESGNVSATEWRQVRVRLNLQLILRGAGHSISQSDGSGEAWSQEKLFIFDFPQSIIRALVFVNYL